MVDLIAIPTADLRAEIARREKAEQDRIWREINKRFGPCPECGAEVVGTLSQDTVQEFYSAPGWQGWPVPPPPDWPGKQYDGREVEITIVCPNGHRRYEREVKFAAKREP